MRFGTFLSISTFLASVTLGAGMSSWPQMQQPIFIVGTLLLFGVFVVTAWQSWRHQTGSASTMSKYPDFDAAMRAYQAGELSYEEFQKIRDDDRSDQVRRHGSVGIVSRNNINSPIVGGRIRGMKTAIISEGNISSGIHGTDIGDK